MLVRKDKWNSSMNCCQGKSVEEAQMEREESAWWLEAIQAHSGGIVHFCGQVLRPSYISPPSTIDLPQPIWAQIMLLRNLSEPEASMLLSVVLLLSTRLWEGGA